MLFTYSLPNETNITRQVIYIPAKNASNFLCWIKKIWMQGGRLSLKWGKICQDHGVLNRMKTTRKISGFCFLLLAGFLMLAIPSRSQLASPAAKAECKFTNGKTIHVDYFSPRVSGRKIFGDVVPFGQVWRAGANAATTFVTDTALLVGSKSVPAGNYTVFVLPTESKWTLIISKKTGEQGIPYPGEQFDFARMEMKISIVPSPAENFTISFNQSGASCTMNFDWETTRASIDISEKK